MIAQIGAKRVHTYFSGWLSMAFGNRKAKHIRLECSCCLVVVQTQKPWTPTVAKMVEDEPAYYLCLCCVKPLVDTLGGQG